VWAREERKERVGESYSKVRPPFSNPRYATGWLVWRIFSYVISIKFTGFLSIQTSHVLQKDLSILRNCNLRFAS
jgi:hypothetical protein